jgi:hypothetical protein
MEGMMAHGELVMTREELERGFARGRTLTQEEWAHPLERQWIDELIAEGKAKVIDDWRYLDGFQCERRRVQGVQLSPPPRL